MPWPGEQIKPEIEFVILVVYFFQAGDLRTADDALEGHDALGNCNLDRPQKAGFAKHTMSAGVHFQDGFGVDADNALRENKIGMALNVEANYEKMFTGNVSSNTTVWTNFRKNFFSRVRTVLKKTWHS